MVTYNVVLLPGDGVGPEISSIAKKILNKVSIRYNFSINFQEHNIGGSAYEFTGNPLPSETIEACKRADSILLAAIGNPKFDNLPRDLRPESALLKLRSELKLFANLRPVKVYSSLTDASTLKNDIIKNVDLIVVRELIGGIYFGIPKGRIKTNDEERAFNTMSYSSSEIDRISAIAFDLAQKRRFKVCSIDKSNVLDVSQLWRERVNEVSVKYPNVEVSHLYVDNAAMQLIRDPSQFDVILTGNLFGDIISDEAAMIAGSIGMLPSASVGEFGPGLYEPVHGSAPDIANKDIANPIAMILSAAMMLRIGLNESSAANTIEKAVEEALAKGFRTVDLMKDGCLELGCQAMGEEIMKLI